MQADDTSSESNNIATSDYDRFTTSPSSVSSFDSVIRCANLRHTTEQSREWVISEICNIFRKINQAVLDGKSPTITLLTRGKASMVYETSSNMLCRRSGRSRILRFITSRNSHHTGFLVVYRVLELILFALVNNIVTTKRDIYYKDRALFGTQNTVDRAIDDIACTLNVPRHSLHVVAAAKGLFCGKIRVIASQIINCSFEETIIPSAVKHIEIPPLAYVLVIEKEAAFQSLIRFCQNSPHGTGLIITVRRYNMSC